MTLYLVATPIGNLEDLTFRALALLKSVDAIMCEDTRHTQKILNHFGFAKPLIRYDEHVHRRVSPVVVERLKKGDNLALVSDAGTPGLSDPGQRLVTDAVAAGIVVTPIPGPSALLTALAGSGFTWGKFSFLGFLSPRPGRAEKEIRAALSTGPVVFYESPHRVVKTLRWALERFGERPVVVARELTKIHEEFLRGSLTEVTQTLSARGEIKGEITVVLSPEGSAV